MIMIKRLFKNFENFDFRIILPLIIILSFAYGINEHIQNLKKKDITEFTYIVPTVTSPPVCTDNYTSRNSYNVSEYEINSKDIKNFRELWIKNFKYIIPTDNQKVLRYEESSYSPQLNSIVYIEKGESLSGEITDYVYLKNVDNGNEEIIYKMKEIPVESRGEYTKQLTGVSFSDDSSMIGITTGESFIIYHLETKAIETIFTDNREPMSFGVFSYSIPYSWPIDNKVFVREGYYEGRGGSIVDLEKKTKTSLEYMVYGTGEDVVGIYEKNLIVVKTSHNENPKLFFVDINTQVEVIDENFNSAIWNVTVEDDNLYAITDYKTEDKSTQCQNNVYVSSLIRYNLKSKEKTTLLVFDSTKSNNNYHNMNPLSYSHNPTSQEFYINMRWGDVPMSYIANESKLDQIIPIIDSIPTIESNYSNKVLDRTKLFNLFNKLRLYNKVSEFKENDEVCNVAQANLSLLVDIGNRLPTDEERSKVDKSVQLEKVISLVGFNMGSEEQAIHESLKTNKTYFFTDSNYEYGCLKTQDNYFALTVGY